MIESLKVTDNKSAPFLYLSELPTFKNKKQYKFKKGVNVIIGPNGCGKTTLLNLLRVYTFCDKELESTMSLCNLLESKKGSFHRLTRSLLNEVFLGGIDVVADYSIKTFNLCEGDDYLSSDEYSKERLFARMERNVKSAGEERIFFFDMMCGKMFNEKIGFRINYDYCSEDARELAKAYYDRNHKAGEVRPTILMDEPDRNLDVHNLKMLSDILGKDQREDTQVIAVIHNPALIYKLSKVGNVNFIEMKAGYLNEILNFVTM